MLLLDATAFVDFNDYYYFMWCLMGAWVWMNGRMVDLMVQSNQFSIWRGGRGGGMKFNSLCLTRHMLQRCTQNGFQIFWLNPTNRTSTNNKSILKNLHVQNDWRGSGMIKSLSRIFLNHVFVVQIQKQKYRIEMAWLQSLSIEWIAFIHCTIVPFVRMVLLARDTRDIYAVYQHQIIDCAVVGSSRRTQCQFQNEKSIESTFLCVNIIIKSNQMCIVYAPIWKQPILGRFRFCSSFGRSFQEIWSSTLL